MFRGVLFEFGVIQGSVEVFCIFFLILNGVINIY